jgi:hypothetical protein
MVKYCLKTRFAPLLFSHLGIGLKKEIYNDKGFDLLDENRDDSRRLEDLPQVRAQPGFQRV